MKVKEIAIKVFEHNNGEGKLLIKIVRMKKGGLAQNGIYGVC